MVWDQVPGVSDTRVRASVQAVQNMFFFFYVSIKDKEQKKISFMQMRTC